MSERIPRELGEEVLKALAIMAEVLANPKEINETLVKAWTLTLASAGVRPDEVEPAVGRALQTQTFFPTPADFLKLLRPPEDREAGEELAWQRTLSAVRHLGRYASLCAADFEGDGTALWTVSRMGWGRLCDELDADNRAIWRAEFMRTYRLGVQAKAALSYLAGSQERDNDARGLPLTPILCGRPDWKELPARTGETPALPAGHAPLSEAGAQAQLEQLAAKIGRPMPEADPDIPEPLRQKARSWAEATR